MGKELNAAHRARLIEIVKARSFTTGGETKLVSGRTSLFYFNMKTTMLHPEGAHLIGQLVCERLAGENVDMVGGLEMGAVPLASAVAAVSGGAEHQSLPAFFVRKQTKEHGTQALIEGLAAGETMAGKRLVVVEDVTTTGGSALKAVDTLKQAGAEVVLVLTIVDRQEGARDAFAAAGVPFDALLTVDDFRS
jgi:orotate phosphoribosyltransferase